MARGRPPPKKKGKKASGKKTVNTKDRTPTPEPDHLKLPTDVLHQIFRLSDTPTLLSCMRVSRQWYAAAGPLLYRAVTIDCRRNMQAVLAGRKKAERQATAEQAEQSNFKAELVAKIQHLTVQAHKCRIRTPSKDAVSQLDTLVVHPSSSRQIAFCDLFACPLLQNARARKVILRDILLKPGEYSPWLTMKQIRSIHIDAQLTLVFTGNTRICHRAPIKSDYTQIDTKRVQKLRIVVSFALVLDAVHGDSLSVYKTQRRPRTHIDLIIGPVMAWSAAEIEIYLFPPFGGISWSKSKVAKILDDYFARQETEMSAVATPTRSPGTCRPNYTIKGLEEYFEEGCEDELYPQELKYWRDRYALLKSQGKRSVI